MGICLTIGYYFIYVNFFDFYIGSFFYWEYFNQSVFELLGDFRYWEEEKERLFVVCL